MSRMTTPAGDFRDALQAMILRALPEADVLAGLPAQKLPRWLRQPLVHGWGREVVTA